MVCSYLYPSLWWISHANDDCRIVSTIVSTRQLLYDQCMIYDASCIRLIDDNPSAGRRGAVRGGVSRSITNRMSRPDGRRECALAVIDC